MIRVRLASQPLSSTRTAATSYCNELQQDLSASRSGLATAFA
eukprot:CAMPEP_0203894662 /NCGR_PEP_ID=MMETSP0359-20131031/37595_1 /ASSEMBLY_ACC=CAM_ASM_000338 /TAXON_ID=268821 /ORGANISM="Scrippsiella Hangoei, Strain SHTV-5" /LENGTH=41 /DNA_ID= /DNA_START= /DNA_END= /DNA_ORIENTATION=